MGKNSRVKKDPCGSEDHSREKIFPVMVFRPGRIRPGSAPDGRAGIGNFCPLSSYDS